MGRKKPQLLEKVLMEGLADDGKCVGHHEGMAVFAREVAPGDLVDISAIKRRNRYFEGRVVKFHHLSENRVEPVCQHFGTCGGCKWQHVSYDTQLSEKQKIIHDNLVRLGKLDLPEINPILGSRDTYHYRNKLEFTFSNKRWLSKAELDSTEIFDKNALGFHVPGLYDKVVNVATCHLQREPTNAIKNEVRDYALAHGLSFYDIREKTGFLRNLIIRIASTEELMVILQVGEEHEALVPLLDHLAAKFPQITSLLYVINGKMNETFYDLPVQRHQGAEHIWEEMTSFHDPNKKLRFRIGPKSFFQTNSKQAELLYRTALSFADLKGNEVVYDLYSGTGTITLYASYMATKVIGVEFVEEAVHDAKINADANGVSNVDFVAGDMKDTIDDAFIEKHGAPDVIITDPPRAGMHQDAVEKILELSPKKVVYISCNPATQARDLALMSEVYEAGKVQPVDMFPHTGHMENVVLLELKR